MRSKKVIAVLLTAAALMGMTVTGCGNRLNENATFATLDDTTITMGVANLFAKYTQAVYEANYMSFFGEDMWNSDLSGNGTTFSQEVKTNLADGLQAMYLLKAHMQEYDVSLSEAEEAEITKAAEDFMAANSKAAIRQMGAENIENVKEMLRLQAIQVKMHERIIEDANVEITDEEAAQRTFSYVELDSTGYTTEDEEYVEYTEEEKASVKESAEAIAKAKDFDAAVTEAGQTVSTYSYGSASDADATLNTVVLEAADKLKEGEISEVIETDTAYYVLRLDSENDKEATAAKKESLLTEKQEAYYEDILDGWKQEAKWTLNEKEWEKVTFEDHFTQSVQETESLEATETE